MTIANRLTRAVAFASLILVASACGAEEQLGTDSTDASADVSATETDSSTGGSTVDVTVDEPSSSDESATTGSTIAGTGSTVEPSTSDGSGSGSTPTTKPKGGGSSSTSTTLSSQSITVYPVPGGWVYGDTRTVIATASSGLKVGLSAGGACQFANADLGLLKATGVGTCTVTARQDGGPGYRAATPVSVSAPIAQGTARIDGFGNRSVEHPHTPFTIPLSATATSGAAVRYRVLPDEFGETKCGLSGNSLQVPLFEGLPRNCVVEAYVDASAVYTGASARATIVLNPTVVKFTGRSGPTVGPTSAYVTVTINRRWSGVEHSSSCGSTSSSPDGESDSYTVTVVYDQPATSGASCTLFVNTSTPDGAVTTGTAEFTFTIP
jgi:hypothetical protein